jgi:Rieske 2Fe-2S family protein
MSHRIEPLSITSSRVECEWLFPPEASERDGFDPSYAVEFWDITNKEDWSACEAVTRGASSRGYRQGPLAPAEDAVHDFMTMVARGYLGSSPSGTRLRMAQ